MSALTLVGCPETVDPPGTDTGGVDGGRFDAPGLDAPRPDGAPALCGSDADCDDDTFCNGDETCDPSDPSADDDGCVAGDTACTAPLVCDEGADMCRGCDDADMDADGFDSIACGGTDCDDGDRNRSPGRTEVCDALNVDEDCVATTIGFRDQDSDGFIDAACCNDATCGDDCNDLRPTTHPTATETCDGLDNDCNGMTDEGVLSPYYVDADGDGFGVDDAATNQLACFQPTGFTATPGDCNDDPTMGGDDIQPGAYDVCDGVIDHDCDGTVDNPPDGCGCNPATDPPRPCPLPGICATGTQTCVLGRWDDCDVPHPTSETVCNMLDDDCDGTADDGLSVVCYADDDADRYAGSGAPPTDRCPDPARPVVGGCPVGFTDRAPVGAMIDCELLNGSIAPGVTETCNGVDDNCSGAIDEGLTVLCYSDFDNDTYATMGASAQAVCPDPGRPSLGMCPLLFTNRAPATLATADCADTDPNRSPAAMEFCDAAMLDEDCDLMANEGVTVACYRDLDIDGFAPTGTAAMQLCPDMASNCPVGFTRVQPTGSGTIDCNDGVASVAPGRPESCNSIDDNCNGSIDEGVLARFYRDADNDLYGAVGSFIEACSAPSGYVTSSLDCNDGSPTIYPGAAETCNGLDDNCSGLPDEGIPLISVFIDADVDGYGGTMTAMRCGTVPGFTLTSTDCNDANAAVHPGGNDICGNGIDEDCTMGDGFPRPTWYPDVDGDNFGSNTGTVTDCVAPVGRWVSVGGDCNDALGYDFVYPGAMELCDGLDTDCTTTAGAGEIVNTFGLNHPLEDNDSDGRGDGACTYPPAISPGLVTPTLNDCNDVDATVYSGATEIVGNGVDNDCNGGEICFRDGDDDGYRHTTTTMTVVSSDADCADTTEGALAEPATDCNDMNAAVSPGDPELPDNGLDDNCNAAHGCYFDADNDGYSRSDGAIHDDSVDAACTGSGEGTLAEPRTDCNDGNAAISPGDSELADNGIDDNCSGYYGCFFDADNDGYRPPGTAVNDSSVDADCLDAYEGQTGDATTDCGDTRPFQYPGASVIADNGLDDNCSGFHECYYDADNDGFSRSDGAIRDDSADSLCTSSGEGRVSEALTDCCDTSVTTNTSQTGWFTSANACSSYDYNCSGTSERQYTVNASATCTTGTFSSCSSSSRTGWTTASDPNCGSTGTWRECEWEEDPSPPPPGVCFDFSYPLQQACH